MFGYMWRLALRESNASLEVHLANLSHILVEIWETPYLKYRILHSHMFNIKICVKKFWLHQLYVSLLQLAKVVCHFYL